MCQSCSVLDIKNTNSKDILLLFSSKWKREIERWGGGREGDRAGQRGTSSADAQCLKRGDGNRIGI